MSTSPNPADASNAWRTTDIVVAAVVAVAFGVVFVAWNALYAAAGPVFTFFWPAQAAMYGVWLLPGVLVGLIVRRPGAAFFGGFVSAAVSVLLGSPYGVDALISGAIQGGGAELGFAIGLYRAWNLPFAILAGALAGLAAAVHDVPLYYPEVGLPLQLAYGAFTIGSGAIVAGIGAWLLVRALAGTGVLSAFPSGRSQEPI
ncbi:MAG: ECF transporter S component [Candidatus Limnocylindria bacterium]